VSADTPPPDRGAATAGDDTLAVGDAFAGAAARVGRPAGLLLLAAYLFVGFAGTVATTTLFGQLLPQFREAVIANSAATPSELPAFTPSPLALSTTPETAVAMVAVTALLAEAVNVVAIRTFVREAESVPGEVVDGLASVTARSFLANVLAQVAVFVGLVAFVLPGVFLAIGFYLVRPVIAIEGGGVLPALRRSWRLAAGNRARVLLVLLTLVLLGQFATLPGAMLGSGGTAGVVGSVLGVLLGAAVTTFGAAVAARVYVRLAGIDAAQERTPGTTDRTVDDTDTAADADEEPLGALSPEEIDERFDGDDRL
jgi:hypothetical protein